MALPDAIINPFPPKGGPFLPPQVAMIGNPFDLAQICDHLAIDKSAFRSFMTSRLYADKSRPYSLIGPMIGAPLAAMILETLIAWGARNFLFFGWCGAISPDVEIGDIIVPTGAWVDEGTSLHYGKKTGELINAGDTIRSQIQTTLRRSETPFHAGKIWTTDGFFRETPEQVTRFQALEALAVEMELSALLSVASFRKIDIGAILVVSDTLADLTWQYGIKEKRFKDQRKKICEVISQICLQQ